MALGAKGDRRLGHDTPGGPRAYRGNGWVPACLTPRFLGSERNIWNRTVTRQYQRTV